MNKINSSLSKNAYYFSWLIALVSLIGSLYFSEVRGLAPCLLCWYQRILMYPLVAIILVGMIRKDTDLPYYVFPLSFIGLGFAAYHWLLQMGVIPEAAAPCTLDGVSCVTKDFIAFGFVTIPFLSLLAFAAITYLMFLTRSTQRQS